jgi:drug/metabolite transporter (DMT)-like permease
LKVLKIFISPATLLVLSVFIQSFSFLCIKLSTLYSNVSSYLLLILALACIFSRAIIWQKIISVMPLSKAYPYTSLVQILILGYSFFLFGEEVSLNNIIGILLMIAGVTIISTNKS